MWRPVMMLSSSSLPCCSIEADPTTWRLSRPKRPNPIPIGKRKSADLSADRALTAGCHRNNIPTRAQLASVASGEKTKSRASLLKWPPLPTPKKKRKPSDEDFFRCSRYQCCCCCCCNCRYSSHPGGPVLSRRQSSCCWPVQQRCCWSSLPTMLSNWCRC